MSKFIAEEEKVEFLRQASRMALDKGITTLHALDGGDLGPGDSRVIWNTRDKFDVRVVCYNQSMDLAEVKELGLPRVGGCICADGAFKEKEKWTIEPDKLADLVLLQSDPFSVDAAKISDIKIETVYLGGKSFDR